MSYIFNLKKAHFLIRISETFFNQQEEQICKESASSSNFVVKPPLLFPLKQERMILELIEDMSCILF